MAFNWLDAYGRPIDRTALKTEQAAPTTRSIRRHDAHHTAAGLTPGRLAHVLRDSIDGDPEHYLALAEDMEERDLHYSGVLAIRKRQVAGLEITVKPAGDDPESEKAAALVREVLDRDGFEEELVDILDAIGKGFSCTEILWDTSEGQWRPKRLAWRDPRWFVFDQLDGETPLLRDGGQNVPLNPYKWIFHSAKVKSGLPIRGGIARAAAWSFLFKSFTVKDWAIFCEAYGQPMRLGKYGPDAGDKEKDTLLEAVTNIGTDYAAIVPNSMTIEFIKADIAGSHELYEKRADWLDRQVSKVVLGQTATTDAIAGGHAVGKTHDRVREDIERADAKQGGATLNRDLVRPIVDLNMGPQKKYPKILIGRAEDVDTDKFMGTVERFVKLGGKVGASAVRAKIGLPEPRPDDELLSAPSSGSMPAAAPVQPEAVDPSDKDGANAADIDFARNMIPHHEAAIDMAKAQLKNGKNPEMRRLATQIITAQEGEIDLLEKWLETKPQPKAAPAGMAKMAAHSADRRKRSPSEADVSFARDMIPHHEAAIEMATEELKKGTDPEMRKLAEEIIEAQEAEIERLKEWLEERDEKPRTSSKKKMAAHSVDTGGGLDAVDDATSEILGDWRPLVAPIVAGLGDAIAAARSAEEVEAVLARRFANMDVTQLTEQLARAAFTARISGEANEDL